MDASNEHVKDKESGEGDKSGENGMRRERKMDCILFSFLYSKHGSIHTHVANSMY